MSLGTVTSKFFEGGDIGTVALLRGPNGTPLTIAQVTKWQLVVFDLSDLNELTRARPVYELLAVNPATENTNAAVPATPLVISDTLRLDGYWPKAAPSTGYNFLHILRRLGNNVRTGDGMDAYIRPFNPKGGRLYRLEYSFLTLFGEMGLVHHAEAETVCSTKIT